MEQNPIYRLEFKQLRRGGFPYAMAVAGLVMSGFLYVQARYGLEFDSSTPPHMVLGMIPVIFYTLGILGVPLIAGLRFAFQQVNEEMIYETPLSGTSIVLGKFRSALVLVLCLYLPALPGTVYQTYRGEFGHLFGCMACAALTAALSAAAVGFAAGTKTAAGALGKIVWVAVYAFFGFSLFSMTVFAVHSTLFEFRVDRSPWLGESVVLFCAIFWGSLGTVLPLWRGCRTMDKLRKPNRLIVTLFALWIVTIGVSILFLLFRMFCGLYVDGGPLVYVTIAASVFYFSCMVGDQEKVKSRSVTFY